MSYGPKGPDDIINRMSGVCFKRHVLSAGPAVALDAGWARSFGSCASRWGAAQIVDMTLMSILLIDDHEVFRRGMRMLLCEAHLGAKVTEAESIEQALAMPIPVAPTLALLDIKLPGVSGLEGIPLLKQRWPDMIVVILSALDTPEVFAYGATEFVSKREPAESILSRIAEAMNRKNLSSPLTVAEHAHLTPRQRDVLALMCQGLSNKLIARQLTLAENTVRRHVQDILEYFQVVSRTEAVNVARRRGLID